MARQDIRKLYRPNHDEASRQAFVAALKGVVNGPLEGELAGEYETSLRPAFEERHGAAPKSRADAASAFEDSELFRLWGSLVYTSQDLLWEAVGQTVDRQRETFEDLAHSPREPLGSLELNPQLDIPEPIASTEIHRQPGGYFKAANDADLTAPLLYFSSIELYRKAKGLSPGSDTGEPGMGRFIIENLRNKFGDIAPRRILDMGCGVGTDTIALCEAFPQAEVHAVDLSGPFLRFGHLWAEEQGNKIHFKQADAAATGYPDGHFDLIASHILFHETWHDKMPQIMAEAERLLAPGGIFYNADVPYQPERISIPKLATNSWQVEHNGEPFWAGFADSDVSKALSDAGFDKGNVFAEYVPLGQGHYFMFGAQKDA